MKYMLQIYGNLTREQGAALPDDERNALYQAWGAVNQTPGMTPGVELADPAGLEGQGEDRQAFHQVTRTDWAPVVRGGCLAR